MLIGVYGQEKRKNIDNKNFFDLCYIERMSYYKFLFLLFFVLVSEKVFSYKVVDDRGITLSFSKPPRKVISLAPSITENLYYIGVIDRVIGVSNYDNFPPNLKATRIGGIITPNLELIISLSPELVIATFTGNSKNSVYNIERQGIKSFVVRMDSIEDIASSILKFGKIFRIDTTRLYNEFMKNVVEKKSPLQFRGVIILSYKPLIVARKGSFLSDIMERSGIENIIKDTFSLYPKISLEYLIEKSPKVIILLSNCHKEELQRFLPKSRIFCIPKDKRDIFFRPSFRVLYAIRFMNEMIYGKKYNNIAESNN